MEGAPLPTILTPKEEIKKSYEINQEGNNYKLNIKIINQEITLNILDEKDLMKEHEIKLTFDELKNLHKIFLTINFCQDFLDFINAIIENKKLLIKKNQENKMAIEIIVEYLYKQNIIKLDLNQNKMNFELIAQDLYQKIANINEICKNLEINYNQLIKENNILKQENQKLNDKNIKIEERIRIIEDENKNLINRINNLEMKMNSPNKEIINIKQNNSSNSIDFNSAIMEKNEFDMIHNAIKEKMNKKIKELKKLYQATKDGGNPDNFHKLCDGISNTLVLYKSAGNRRFGGFTSQSWKSNGERIPDKNCFLFSLDKKKIYHSNKF